MLCYDAFMSENISYRIFLLHVFSEIKRNEKFSLFTNNTHMKYNIIKSIREQTNLIEFIHWESFLDFKLPVLRYKKSFSSDMCHIFKMRF